MGQYGFGCIVAEPWAVMLPLQPGLRVPVCIAVVSSVLLSPFPAYSVVAVQLVAVTLPSLIL